jgi:hypothetical protein
MNESGRNAMNAKFFGTVGLLMLPTIAIAANAGSGPAAGVKPNSPLEVKAHRVQVAQNMQKDEKARADAAKPDNAKAAGTGGGDGAAPPTKTSNNGDGKVGAQGAAAASQGAPGNENKPANTEAAGDGGGTGAKTSPEKTP